MEWEMQTFRSQDMQRQAAVLQEAAMKEPVIITYHDRPRLVLMSMQEYDRLRGRRRKTASVAEIPEAKARQIESLGRENETRRKPERSISHGRHS
jgi:prevent-host-death family protein